MKYIAGWATAILFAVGTTLGIFSTITKSAIRPAASLPGAPVIAATATKPTPAQSPCASLVHHLNTLFAISDTYSLPTPTSCKQPGVPALPEKPAPNNIRFIIATLPDPIHTHLSLIFDRNAEAIQQAAQAESYTYDSSWLPWDANGDHNTTDSEKAAREDQPGIILFRKAVKIDINNEGKKTAIHPYDNALIVFVVGEEATTGIHRVQFENAVKWIDTLRVPDNPNRLQILGPTFSGSLPTLAQLLQDIHLDKDDKHPLDIYSGHVTSSQDVKWFLSKMSYPDPQDPTKTKTKTKTKTQTETKTLSGVHFLSFQQDDSTVQERYFRFLERAHIQRARIAIVSEDETAYGKTCFSCSETPVNSQTPTAPQTPADAHTTPALFYYPRDISALRAAYQQQSLFSNDASQTSTETPRHTLRSDFADVEGTAHDTIQNYGGNQTALSQEAVLLQIVSMLRSHRSQYILIKSSNPLDQLFLAHFFKLTYPEARVVILGNDLLLRREAGSGGLNGIMTLSTFPLLPDSDDWEKFDPTNLDTEHRVFAHVNAEASYIALRFLLHPDLKCKLTQLPSVFVPPNCDPDDFNLPDYARLFWNQIPGDQNNRPLTWLSVLGNDGFWPVAALDDPTDPPSPDKTATKVCPSIAFFHTVMYIFLAPFPNSSSTSPFTRKKEVRWPFIPLSLKITIILLLLWSVFHAWCCMSPSITVKPDHRAYFVRSTNFAHTALVVFGSSLVSIAFTVLAGGYGWMSDVGGPHNNPILFGILPVIVWFTGLVAVAANSWIESSIAAGLRQRPSSLRRFLKATWRGTLAYTLFTFVFYALYVRYLDNSLGTQIRVPTYIRSMNLTTGVSPVVPMIFLVCGMYGWFWCSLRGAAGLSSGRPRLPLERDLKIQSSDTVDTQEGPAFENLLPMLARDTAGDAIEDLCAPFHRDTWIMLLSLLIGLCVSIPLAGGGIPIRSLGTQNFSIFISVWIAISISILLANAWQMIRIWRRLRALLQFLDRFPLRRTMLALHGFSWGSIWKIGGNNLDMRYKLISRQYEALGHLSAALDTLPKQLAKVSQARITACNNQIEVTRERRKDFALWYARHWNDWKARDPDCLQILQKSFAKTASCILTQILLPSWHTETASLLTISTDPKDAAAASPILDDYLKAAEEFVCLVYLGFIQNTLGRIRTFVMGIVCLFISIALVLPSYPFDPRPVLTAAVVILFLIVSIVVFFVYSQMFRDSTLSHLTNTNPGQLGSEFWLKFLSFGIGPIFGLLATISPQLSDFISSWLQPSLSSIK